MGVSIFKLKFGKNSATSKGSKHILHHIRFASATTTTITTTTTTCTTTTITIAAHLNLLCW